VASGDTVTAGRVGGRTPNLRTRRCHVTYRCLASLSLLSVLIRLSWMISFQRRQYTRLQVEVLHFSHLDGPAGAKRLALRCRRHSAALGRPR
jgi:hypothetical protein